MEKKWLILGGSMETVNFSWDREKNENRLERLKDRLAEEFSNETIDVNLVHKNDQFLLRIYLAGEENLVKIVELPCNPGQYRTVPGIVEAVRNALRRRMEEGR